MSRRGTLARHAAIVLCGACIWGVSLFAQDAIWAGVCRFWGCKAADLHVGIWRLFFAYASGGLLILAWIIVALGGRGWRAMAGWVALSSIALWVGFHIESMDIVFAITLLTTLGGGLTVMGIARRILPR